MALSVGAIVTIARALVDVAMRQLNAARGDEPAAIFAYGKAELREFGCSACRQRRKYRARHCDQQFQNSNLGIVQRVHDLVTITLRFAHSMFCTLNFVEAGGRC